MGRVAILVDAGYVWHNGVATWHGSRLHRNKVDLQPANMVDLLSTKAIEASRGSSVLRVYWYDAVPREGFEPMQTYIAMARNVKFRAGTLVRSGDGGARQKGVDTLIVADMIQLARNGAVSDFFLVSGDDDLRVGVQLAQGAGVRVHLAGIEPAPRSQSRNLRQEADTLIELTKEELGQFLSVVPEQKRKISIHRTVLDSLGVPGAVDEIVRQMLDSHESGTWNSVLAQRQSPDFTVPWVSRRLVGAFEKIVARKITPPETRQLHQRFAQELANRIAQP